MEFLAKYWGNWNPNFGASQACIDIFGDYLQMYLPSVHVKMGRGKTWESKVLGNPESAINNEREISDKEALSELESFDNSN